MESTLLIPMLGPTPNSSATRSTKWKKRNDYMHDPMTVAFEIKSPIKVSNKTHVSKCFPEGYRNTLVTIWHVDPEKNGSDDSCGWFKRPRHGNQEHYSRIQREFEYDWDKHSTYEDGRTMFLGWFHPSGEPLYSAHAIALGFFWRAALIHFNGSQRKATRFMVKHHHDIIWFAENPTDSMVDTIANKYREKRDQRIRSMASMVYGCILRWSLPWWKHPRWHIHHWKIQVHSLQNFKRWAFSRCCKCGGRFKWGASACTSDWNGTGPQWFSGEKNIYHDDCIGVSVGSEALKMKVEPTGAEKEERK